MRPAARFMWKEVLTVVIIALLCYLNYFILYPRLFKKHKWIYFILLIIAVFAAVVAEMSFVKEDIKNCFHIAPHLYPMLIRYNYFQLFLRDICFLAFFVILRLYKDAVASYKLEKEKAFLEHEKQQIEIDNLKSKIAPHFLFNNLNKIYNDIEPLSEPVANKILGMSKLLRVIIEDNGAPWVPLEKEISFIKNLLLLENDYRYKNLDISFLFDTERQSQNLLVPPLIFENFVSNAFKFVKKKDGYIRITINVVEGKNCILVVKTI